MEFNRGEFSLVLKQDLVWGDMDAFQHINNTVYFRYFEDIRMAYFSKVGVNEFMERKKIGPILARTECDFRLPLSYPDEIEIGTKCEVLSEKKFIMYTGSKTVGHKALRGRGIGLVLFYDYVKNKGGETQIKIVKKFKMDKTKN